MIDFRERRPNRTCDKIYSNYRRYKSYLAKDFNNRCGYTDCPDFWFGGPRAFHIDHFIPQSKGPDASKNDYGNLVYTCSYVNILKSDDSEINYLDPCEEDYNNHFYRNKSGEIFPRETSRKAKYMHSRLKLYLARYSIIWMLEKISDRMDRLAEIDVSCLDSAEHDEVTNALAELTRAFVEYRKYLSCNQ